MEVSMSGRQKQHWIRCRHCRWGDTRVWVPLACPGCGRGGERWAVAPEWIPRKVANWNKVLKERQFVAMVGYLGPARTATEVAEGLRQCRERLEARWLKEFGVKYGKRVGDRSVSELVDTWRGPRGGEWVMVQAWYKRAAGGD